MISSIPPRWKRVTSSHDGNTQFYEHVDVRCVIETWADPAAPLWVGVRGSVDRQTLPRIAVDIASIIEWDRHERAVRAQAPTGVEP